MAIESQSALANLAADTIRVDATNADIVKAANAKAAAAKPGAKTLSYHAKSISYHAKAAVAIHSFYFSIAGGVIIGVAAYHLVNKFWLKKDKTAE